MKMNKIVAFVMAFAILGMTGCRKPYDTPEYKNVGANQTAFLLDLEDTGNQDMFRSAEFLEKKMVAAKRVRITHRWNQTGRRSWQGHYLPTVKLVTVDRTPVTRHWSAEATTGTSSANQMLEAESKDSLGVDAGFTLTASITPEDASTYLFRYKEKALSAVIDSQVKNSVQVAFAEKCQEYDLLELPNHKAEIVAHIKETVIPFYKEWGITIEEDMGIVGGLIYDPAIQAAYDRTFEAEKIKEAREAEEQAQIVENRRLLSIKEREAAEMKLNADAEAYSIGKVAEAIKMAGPMYIKDKYLDKWDGILPKYSGGGESMDLIFNTGE